MSKKNSKRRKQTDPELNLLEQDENFYFIAGYTSGGAPYGITWEEAAEINHSIQQLNCTVFSKIMNPNQILLCFRYCSDICLGVSIAPFSSQQIVMLYSAPA